MYGRMNKQINKRSVWLLAIFAVAWLGVCLRLFYLQVISHEEYQQKVNENVQSSRSTDAPRGNIFDRNRELLVTNVNVWRVFVSPVDIVDREQAEFISEELSKILDVDKDMILERSLRENRADETVKRNVEKDAADDVRSFIAAYGLEKQVHLETTSKRLYRYDTLASNVIGFAGTDGGSYGVELQYDTYLKGTPGRYVTAKNGLGMSMPFKFDSFVTAEKGYDLVLTLDLRIQQLLEKQLKLTYEDSEATGNSVGIVMDVNSGAILAMAQYPSYNLNSPTELVEPLKERLNAMDLLPGSDEYKQAEENLRFSSWNNQAVSWTYEPGSTFKVITASMALEERMVTDTETFYCKGYINVEGWPLPIYCHKRSGHGTVDFRTGLQQSCNPTLATVGIRLGTDTFYKYFEAYGYTDRTGIDLNGEARGIYAPKYNIHDVELAVYSFGQTFKTTPIQQITAISAVANGGYLVTPHVLDKVVDKDGNTVRSYGTDVKRQIISKETSRYLTGILEEGVSGNGGAKNAYVYGYKVAAKTGTSQKRDILDENGETYLYVGSCVAYAPADNPQIAALILVDQPNDKAIYGSLVAAPYVSDLLEEVLPYLGVEATYTNDDSARVQRSVQSVTGIALDGAINTLKNQGFKYEVIGSGSTVLRQFPPAGTVMFVSTGKVLLYTENVPSTDAYVPNVVGEKAVKANSILVNAGFNIKIEGAMNFEKGAGAIVTKQTPSAGQTLPRGSVITVEFKHTDGTE